MSKSIIKITMQILPDGTCKFETDLKDFDNYFEALGLLELAKQDIISKI